MVALAQVAETMKMYGMGGAVNITTPGADVTVNPTDMIPPFVAPLGALAMILFFAFLALIIWAGVSRAKRRDRLIELAIQHNQPEVAREFVSSKMGFLRFILWVMVIVAVLGMFMEEPGYVFFAGIVALTFLFIGSRLRARVLDRAADGAGRVHDWLAGKAQQNQATGQAPQAPPVPPAAPQQDQQDGPGTPPVQ